MSTVIKDEEITANKKVEERTWRATQFTEDQPPHTGENYFNTIFRERKTTLDGFDPTYSRDRVDPTVVLNDGEDGTDPSHYTDSVAGFEPEVKVKMLEVLSYPRTEEITVIDPATGTNYTVPAAVVPLLLVGIYDTVAAKANQTVLDQAIAEAVAQAIEDQSVTGSPAE